MNGSDIKLYEHTVQRAEDLGMKLEVQGDRIALFKDDGACIGYFLELTTITNFLYGYDKGRSDILNTFKEEGYAV